MQLKEPSSMDECIYFSNRTLEGGKGKVKAWVYRKVCPKCGNASMGKPVESGQVKIRAKEYTCPSCNFTEEKIAHEESLALEASFTCPHCGKQGEGSALYKRKTFLGVPSYVVECPHCRGKIPVTKKMKAPKKKGIKEEADDVE